MPLEKHCFHYKNKGNIKISDTERAARFHIKEIRTQKFFVGKNEPNPLTKDLHHAVTSLSAELYTKDVHFLMELIQNAEDNEYREGVEPTLEFVLTKEDITGSGATATLLVFNNEVGFTKKNVDSICSVGSSTKKGKRQLGFIGEKGIGFKSVFLVSKWPHIFSNGYRVRFREEPDQDCRIGYIVPEWVSGKPYFSKIRDVYGSNNVLPTTTIILPLRPEKVEAVKEQLAHIHPELLLFLSKIKRLYVRGDALDPKEAENVSTISISSETDHVELRDKRADSWVVQLSVKENVHIVEETCRYYMWRQAFPVKTENKVAARMDVEECVITLAFPFGNRLKRGTSSIGIFAFLPTAMVTNFPFVIQADFILASSRETILLDNKWNLGILDCVPSAFLNAFCSCEQQDSPLSSVAQAFEFLPAQISPVLELNKIRESIRAMLQELKIMPCENFSGERFFCQPTCAIRVLPKFRELLIQMKNQGISLKGLSFLKRHVLDSSLDFEEYGAILDFLGVVSIENSYDWYEECIKACNVVSLASDDVYTELLCFIADHQNILPSDCFKSMPLLKYINREGNVEFVTISESKSAKREQKIQYALESKLHSWLSKCNTEFGFLNNVFFLPNSTQKALVSHMTSSYLRHWLASYAGVTCCSAYTYGTQLQSFVSLTKEPTIVVTFSHFLYHLFRKQFIDESGISSLCQKAPLIDGSGHIRMSMAVTLVAASGSKWVKLFGPNNPFKGENYIDIGDVYAESGQFAGEYTPKKVLLSFLSKHARAVDLPELCPPNVALQLASSELTSEQAFLLLDWIRFLRTKGSYLPPKFINSIRNGKWMKTYSGFNSPTQSILPDETGKTIFRMMETVLEGISIVDQEFCSNRIGLYVDELKFLGMGFGSPSVQRLVNERFKSHASLGMSRRWAFLLLMFIRFCKAREIIDVEWLKVMKEGKWLKIHQGYNSPNGSLFLPAVITAESVMKISTQPIVDEMFYGSQLNHFSSELRLLGVVTDVDLTYKLIAQSLTIPVNSNLMTGDCGLLILKCIRCLGTGSAAGVLIRKIIYKPWLKTSYGFRCPFEAILPDSEWGCLLIALKVAAIDELFYGNEIRSFTPELNAIGVAVDFSSAALMIATQFRSLLHSSSLTPANVMALLGCVRKLSDTISLWSLWSSKLYWLFGEKWLKTRHGYKTPAESILFSSKWGSISSFVDLPLIDDAFYGIDIYKYKDELRKLGVMTDFKGGALFVARGLKSPIEPELVTAEATISLLECIKSLMSNSHEQPVVVDFLKTIRKSKFLKTRSGYRTAEECILFDATWKGILKSSDAPFVDEKFYETNISVYKNELTAIGMKADFGDICSLISEFLFSHTETSSITRIYDFLNKFQWKPESLDESRTQVWIPNRNGAGRGEWVNSQLCIVHDKDNLFSSCLYCLDKCYKKELLPIFSSAFGVKEFPTIDDYLQLWNSWVLRDSHQVTARECCSFWEYVLENWNRHTKQALRKNLVQVPATMSTDEEIYLVSKEEVFIQDDLLLKEMFMNVDKIPLFVWFPKCSGLSSVPRRRLYEIYVIIGVRKISESVECDMSNVLLSDHSKKIDPRNGLVVKGFVKIILGFLASRTNMSMEERHKAAKSLIDLSVYETDEPIQVLYRLTLSANTTLNVEAKKMVLREKNSQWLLIKKSGNEDGKANIEFLTSFAQEIAEGLLAQQGKDAMDNLSKIIQMGLMFEFKDDEVDFLLNRENLELYVEDKEFLDASFPPSELSSPSVERKRTCQMLESLGPLTPIASYKRHCQ